MRNTVVKGYICEFAEGVYLRLVKDDSDGNCDYWDTTNAIFEAYIFETEKELNEIIETEYVIEKQDSYVIRHVELSMKEIG